MIDQEFFHLSATVFLVIYVIYDLIRNRHRERSLLRMFVFYSFIYYMIHVIKFTLLPITFIPFRFPASVQLIPFYFVFDSIESGYIGSAYWQNFILLFPLGVFSPLLFRRLRNLKLTILTAFFVSTSIETIQLIMRSIGSNRTFNVDDIILNTSGAIIGYFVYKIMIITFRKFKNSYLLNKFDFGL